MVGDIFDRRKFVNYNTLLRTKKMFFDRLQELDIQFISIVGNHDTYYKSTNEVNSPELLLSQYPNIKIISDDVEEIIFNKTSITFLPWLNPENSERLLIKLLDYSKTDFVLSHLELSGFETLKGIVQKEGMSPKYFENFNQILSGHYHYKSRKDNIFYIGAPYQMSWSDYNSEKGFYSLDTETKELTFIENTITMFNIITYDDSISNPCDTVSQYKNLKHKYVKLVIKNRTNQLQFDMFIDELYKFELANLNIVDEGIYMNDTDGLNENDVEIETTQSTLKKYVNNLDIENNIKNDLNILMENIYNEAVTMECM